MYNVTLELPSEQREAGFLDAGIQENIELTNIEYKKNDAGNEFIAFYFVNPETGEKGSHTEWKARANTPEELATKEMNQMSRIKQIALCFIPKEKFVFSAISFEDFCRKTIALIGDAYKGVKLRAKFVYSNGKYTSLPNYWKFRFIERMDNNGNYGQEMQKSSVKELSIDKFKREPDPISNTPNPFLTPSENPFIS